MSPGTTSISPEDDPRSRRAGQQPAPPRPRRPDPHDATETERRQSHASAVAATWSLPPAKTTRSAMPTSARGSGSWPRLRHLRPEAGAPKAPGGTPRQQPPRSARDSCLVKAADMAEDESVGVQPSDRRSLPHPLVDEGRQVPARVNDRASAVPAPPSAKQIVGRRRADRDKVGRVGIDPAPHDARVQAPQRARITLCRAGVVAAVDDPDRHTPPGSDAHDHAARSGAHGCARCHRDHTAAAPASCSAREPKACGDWNSRRRDTPKTAFRTQAGRGDRSIPEYRWENAGGLCVAKGVVAIFRSRRSRCC